MTLPNNIALSDNGSLIETSHAGAANDVFLSVVVPCFNEEAVLPEFYRRMTLACQQAGVASFELIFINDGSTDGTLSLLRNIRSGDAHVAVLDLARNHGHQLALSAGIAHARGRVLLLIDADLQDPPELLAGMLERLTPGVDVVYGQRRARAGETRWKLLSAAFFYAALARFSGPTIPPNAGDFRLITRRVADVLKDMPEGHRFVRGLVSWVGFGQVAYPYDRDPRFAGVSKYPFARMLALSLDAITSFAIAPLRIVFFAAFVAMALAAVAMVWTIYSYFQLNVVQGWSSVMIAVLFLSSIQLFALALIGEYVGRTFMESKRRPLYIVREFFRAASEVRDDGEASCADTGKPTQIADTTR